MENALKFVGDKLQKATEKDGKKYEPYLPDAALVRAVDVARYLERPLLLKGEPGSGKTRCASAVAFELGCELFVWPVKSTSRARDGLYSYDNVARLRDAQLAASNQLTADELAKSKIPATYVRLGPLGQAMKSATPTVVLIDEIDKADIDFPNDLLLELDEHRFPVEETGEWVEAKIKPFIIVTSNDEKELPAAFLRRCVFHYIDFPEAAPLRAILSAHFPGKDEKLLEESVRVFLQLREKGRAARGRASKAIGTSELVDWVRVLIRNPDQAMAALGCKEVPDPGVLLKNRDELLEYLSKKPRQ
jgi:MoxR-like ATPase